MDYYINKNADSKGNNEVHTSSCSWLRLVNDRGYVGAFSNCRDAIAAAKKAYPYLTPDGCYYCCTECHNG